MWKPQTILNNVPLFIFAPRIHFVLYTVFWVRSAFQWDCLSSRTSSLFYCWRYVRGKKKKLMLIFFFFFFFNWDFISNTIERKSYEAKSEKILSWNVILKNKSLSINLTWRPFEKSFFFFPLCWQETSTKLVNLYPNQTWHIPK